MIRSKKSIFAIAAIAILSLGLLIGFFSTRNVHAETEQERLDRLRQQIEQYQKELDRLKGQASTLSNQIAQFDAQIRLATLKITETEERVTLLGGRINQLEGSLGALTSAFGSRAVHTYKLTRLSDPYLLLVSSNDLSEAVSSFHYLKKIQESDRELLLRLEKAQQVYLEEKTDQEELQEELKDQKASLDTQKQAKAHLLQVTRNDEKKYQQLLASARAEFEAIQAIIAGKGQEEEVGKISQGQRIASVIQGPSCNSSGAHLHFIVSQNGTTQNPFSHLKSGVSFENCSGLSCGSSDGDPFAPAGNWDWPINPTVKYSQGYGSTWAVRNTWVGRIYQFHNGIDINSISSSEVKSVRAGTLFRGSYTGASGCKLRYVRVDHDDSDLDTFYLHIDY